MADPVYIIGNTHKFLLTAQKDGVVWDISTATVTLTLVKPDKSQATKSASLVSGPAGTAQYTTLTTDLDQDGLWFRYWRVVDGTVDLRCGPIPFTVLFVG